MKFKRYTEEPIAFALRQAESGVPVGEIVRKMEILETTFYRGALPLEGRVQKRRRGGACWLYVIQAREGHGGLFRRLLRDEKKTELAQRCDRPGSDGTSLKMLDGDQGAC